MRKLKRQYIVDEKGQKTAAILPIEEYDQLIENLHDLAVIAECKGEVTISFNKLKKRLKRDNKNIFNIINI